MAAFIPLFAGLYWKRATTRGARWAIVAGITSWLALEGFGSPTAIWPLQLVGFLAEGVCLIAVAVADLWSEGGRRGRCYCFNAKRTRRRISSTVKGFFDDVPWVEEFGDVQKTPGICRTAQGNDIGLHEFTRRARG